MTKKILKKNTPSIPYDEWLLKQLKDHDLAAAYLNEALEQSKSGDKESLALLLLAIKNVIQAQGGMTKIAKKSGLGRESLYKTFSQNGNPEFVTVATITQALGLNLRFF